MTDAIAPRASIDRCPIKISIVIPCFNAQRYIAQTLNSVSKQEYANLEVVIVDGGSTDGTLDVVRSAQDLDIKLVSETDQGQLDAVQKGLRMATGEVFYWLNADDILMPNALQLIGQLFENDSNLDLVYSDDFAFEGESRTLSVGATIRWLGYFEHVFFYRQLYSECVFWRATKNRLLPASFFHLRLCTDFAFFANLRYGLKEKWVRKRLGAFRIVPGQVSQMFQGRLASERKFIRDSICRRHGWSSQGLLVRKIVAAPRFFLLQYCFPRLERGLRKLNRALSSDARRKAMTKSFFDVWLAKAAPGVESTMDYEILER